MVPPGSAAEAVVCHPMAATALTKTALVHCLENGDVNLSKKSPIAEKHKSLVRVATLSKRKFCRQGMPEIFSTIVEIDLYIYIETCFTLFDLISLVYGQEWLGSKGLSLLQAR